MAGHDDDPKTRPDDPEKQPLGFQEEPAAPSPEMPERRLLLKIALWGAAGAAFLSQDALHAFTASPSSPGDTLDPSPGEPQPQPGSSLQVPVKLPYANALSFQSQPGALSDADGNQGLYSVSGSGNLQIDGNGTVYLSNIQATGTYVSGALNVGTISIVQPTPSMAGTYKSTTVNAQAMVLYSDGKSSQVPSSFTAQGQIYQGGSDLQIGVQVSVNGRKPDWGVTVTWTKATC
ncbi:MAG TPA: hypothetical protein VMM92_01920 [Thermoanaerobaculia bacterium]|nr:hypothetical protein [Thermoanaerobaculia bacterium]